MPAKGSVVRFRDGEIMAGVRRGCREDRPGRSRGGQRKDRARQHRENAVESVDKA